MAPRRRILRHASRPSAKVENPKARRSWAGGRGWMRRRASVMTPSVPSLPTKSWVRFGPGGGPGSLALGVHDATVGQHHLEADDHVLDLPVAGRVLPRPAAGQPAADGGEVHGLGPVAERVARADLAERGLEVRAEGAGPHVRREGGLVDLAQTVERGQVEGDAAVHRDGAPADAAPTGRRRDGHRGLVAGGEHGRDLLGRGGAHHHRGALRDRPFGRPADGERPPVPSGLGPGVVVEHDLGAAGGEAVEERRRDVDDARAEAVGARRPRSASMGVTGVGSVMGGRARR